MPVRSVLAQFQIDPANSKNRKFVTFASRQLTEVEGRYSQCEKEALAAVWGCERLWIYLFGQSFKLVTDNRAIQLIFGNAASRPPARIERLGLRLSQFDFNIEHRPGKSNISDYFSRYPDDKFNLKDLSDQQQTERYINMVLTNAIPYAVSRAEISKATLEDKDLQELTKFAGNIKTKLPTHLSMYGKSIREISLYQDGILLRGQQIIVPKSVWKRIVQLAHNGHQGIKKKQIFNPFQAMVSSV